MGARIIADTVYKGSRIVSIEADIPTWMLGQVGKHRAFSLSAQSARAVPIEKMIQEVPNWVPGFHGQPGKTKAKGMRDGERLPESTRKALEAAWYGIYAQTVAAARHMACLAANAGYGISKGEINRLLSPFKMSRVILTGLVDDYAWGWLFKLRLHKDSQSEFYKLADDCRSLIEESEPDDSRYHIPYYRDLYSEGVRTLRELIVCSIAKCATVSYRVSSMTPAKAERIAKKLAGEGHWVPFEHVCAAGFGDRVHPRFAGNHARPSAPPVWLQARKFYDEHLPSDYGYTVSIGRGVLKLDYLFKG